MPSARETLFWHYENRSAAALAAHQAGIPVVGYTSNTVPWELIHAAGCFPLLLSPDVHELNQPTPFADPLMEPVFDSRIRSLFDRLLAGAWPYLKLLIIPRTSEAENKLYLYLREVARQKLSDHVPPLYLYDLLHTRTPLSRDYGLARTEELKSRLSQIGAIDDAALLNSIEQSNRARFALDRLRRLRTGPKPRLSGTDALQMSSAFYFMDRAKYAELVNQACNEVAATERDGPRLLIKGMPLHHASLHQAIEQHGATVIAEDDWWGSRAGGGAITVSSQADPMSAIFEKYYFDEPSPRIWPSTAADRWFENAVNQGVDGVIFYLPPDDDVYGWDFPRQLEFVNGKNIRWLIIRDDVNGTLPAETQNKIASFVEALRYGR